MSQEFADSIPWVEKHRPRKLEDLSQEQNLIELFKNNIKTGHMTHYLFYGPPGTGKTSAILAMGREIFKEHFSSRVIEFNASDDRGINAVRDKITTEAKKHVGEIVMEDGYKIPPYKIIILDEADSMTDEAQDALRVIIEQYSTVTRFCFICNYITKITDAIKSRCSAIYFKKLNIECMISKLKEISKKEFMELSENIIKTIIEVSDGDMRKTIMLLQNLKYKYYYKLNADASIYDIKHNSINKKFIPIIDLKSVSTEITDKDIYDIAACIEMKTAHTIISKVTQCKRIYDVTVFSKKIISMGYPIDNVLSQLNKAVSETTILSDFQKATIIKYSGEILLKMKECANEYIQLCDYLSCVYGVYNKNSAYDIQELFNLSI